MQRAYRPWAPVVLWMTFIFLMSTGVASADHTSRVIEPLLRWMNPDISSDAIGLAHLLIRKCGHLFEYAVLAFLVQRAVLRTAVLALASSPARAAGLSWLIATAYALTDELHQTLVASRTGSPGDVLIDAGGALMGLVAFFGVRSFRHLSRIT